MRLEKVSRSPFWYVAFKDNKGRRRRISTGTTNEGLAKRIKARISVELASGRRIMRPGKRLKGIYPDDAAWPRFRRFILQFGTICEKLAVERFEAYCRKYPDEANRPRLYWYLNKCAPAIRQTTPTHPNKTTRAVLVHLYQAWQKYRAFEAEQGTNEERKSKWQ